MDISNTDDIIDSRDVIARIEELEDMRLDPKDPDNHVSDCDGFTDQDDNPQPFDLVECNCTLISSGLNESEREELTILKALAEEGADYSADWQDGEGLIRDSYFKEYAQELADECGMIDNDATWPGNYIDWDRAADELKMDYTLIDFDGVDYWVRA